MVRYSDELMELISNNNWHNLSIIDRQSFIHAGYLSSSRKNQPQDYDPKTYVQVLLKVIFHKKNSKRYNMQYVNKKYFFVKKTHKKFHSYLDA